MTTRSWRYRITRALPLVLAAGLCCLTTAKTSAAANWTLSLVDNSADDGKYVSLAADANKDLHVSYLDTVGTVTNLRYKSKKNGSWTSPVDVVQGNVVTGGTALAVDANNHPQINYYYYTTSSRGIRNIVSDGNIWGVPTAINGAFVPDPDQTASLFTRAGISHLTYVRSAGSTTTLYYAKNTISGLYSFTTATVGTTTLSGTSSLVADSAGIAHIVGYNSSSTSLNYYTNKSGAWVASTVPTTSTAAGKWCALSIDPSDTLHLVYLEAATSPTATKRVMYRYKTASGTWQAAQYIGDAGLQGGYPSIKVQSDGTAHVSYYFSATAGSGTLRYTANPGGAWTTPEDVDTSSADLGRYSSIALDSDNTVSIAYYDVTNSALKLASKQNTAVPAIAVSPASLNFGSVNRGGSSSQPVTITNNGTATLSISSITLTGASFSEFSAGSCATVLPGANCTVSVTANPASGGVKSAELSIASNDPLTPASVVSLSASSPWLISTQVGNGGNGGAISPPGQVSVNPGESLSFTITSAAAPFSLSDVLVDNVTVGAVTSYPFLNVASDHSIEALFVSPIRLFGTPYFYFASLQHAYDAIVGSGTVQSQIATPAGENLLIDQQVAATLKGGYSDNFYSQTGSTSLRSLTISNGNLTPEGLVLE